MEWPKLFAEYVEAATATHDELYEVHPKRVCQEREAEHREQRVLETRSWRDPSNVICRKP